MDARSQLVNSCPGARRPTLQPGVLQRRFYPRFAKVLAGAPLIVGSAAQAKILNRALAAYRVRVDVVELEAATRVAAPPIRRDIAALLTVSYEHRARNLCRVVSSPFHGRVRLWIGC